MNSFESPQIHTDSTIQEKGLGEEQKHPVESGRVAAKGIEDNASELKSIRDIIRTDRSLQHYTDVFGPESVEIKGKILDLGAGDSEFAQRVNDKGGNVVRLDASYFADPPEYKEGAVVGLAHDLPFADNTFKEVVSSYLMEHIPPDKAGRALKEMLRVVEPNGMIKIYPSYYFWGGYKSPYPFVSIQKIGENHLGKTLVIQKEPSLTDEDWQRIIPEITKNARFIPKIPLIPEKVFQSVWRIYMKMLITFRGQKGTNRVKI